LHLQARTSFLLMKGLPLLLQVLEHPPRGNKVAV